VVCLRRMLLSSAGVFGALSWILDSDQLRDLPEVVATTRPRVVQDQGGRLLLVLEAAFADVLASGRLRHSGG